MTEFVPDFRIQVDFQMPAKYCPMRAQPVVAQWQRWRCQPSTVNDL
jgi:hypothetical protein